MELLIREILQYEGVATLVTVDKLGSPHLTASWNSYIEITEKDQLLIPVGGFNKTESNINSGSQLYMIIGSKKVMGSHSLGNGFRLTGNASFLSTGEFYDRIKNRFNWARAVLVFEVKKTDQLL